MKSNVSLIFLLFMLPLFLADCAENSTQIPTTTFEWPTPTRTPEPTPLPRPSSTPRPTWIPRPTDVIWDLGTLGPIAFYSIGSTSGISIMNPDGSGMQLLIPDRAHNFDYQKGFSWSPDGQFLAYSNEGNDDILIYSLKDVRSNNITNVDDKFEMEPDWSPDGKQIVFSGTLNSKRFNIYVMNVDGSHTQQLTDCIENCYNPDWSPDGASIAYQGKNGIYTLKSDGSDGKRVAQGGINQYPAWSPDGTQIAYLHSAGFEEPTYLYLVNKDGSGNRALTDSSVRPNRFSWSPDGRYIVFCNLKPYAALWLLDIASGEVKQINDSNSYSPEWSPIISTTFNPNEPKPVADCTSGWTRLRSGSLAQVTGDVGSTPNRVRSEPKTGDNIIGMLPAGTLVDVLEGPVCTDQLIFWKVHSTLIPGGTGWTAEGNGSDYWLDPYNP